jgi:hypothetical protein
LTEKLAKAHKRFASLTKAEEHYANQYAAHLNSLQAT